jgi:hypothetical protein
MNLTSDDEFFAARAAEHDRGGKMKKEKIKTLFFVLPFSTYFERRARRVLQLKKADYDHVSIDVHPDRGTIWVWLHNPESIVGRAQFKFDGRCYDKLDCRVEEEKI